MSHLNRRRRCLHSVSAPQFLSLFPVLESLEERLLLTFDPTSTEQLMLYDTNRVRVDPQGELNNYLFTSLSPLTSPDADVNFAMSFFSVNSTQFLNEWSALASTAPLAWNSSLYAAAAGHNAAMIAADEQSHQVAGEPALGTRLTNAGYTGWTSAAENVYAYANTEFYGHSGFLIDWGNVTPGHRNNIMNSNYNEVGISITPESNGATDVGPLVITQDFGRRSILPEMVGVVYTDANSNSRYDAGEGLSNVNITITGANGTYATTSMTAGGWQKDVPAGTYKVVVSGGGFSGSTELTVTLSTSNRQVDFVSGSVGGYVNFVRQYPSPETLGVVRNATFYFDANNTRFWEGTSAGDAKGDFGNSSDIPVSGDFNGDGYDEIGVFRNGLWYIDLNGDRAWSGTGAGQDVVYNFGIAGDKPIVGDWDGDGFDSIGVVRNATWYLDLNENGVWNGSGTDGLYSFGAATDTPIVGDWNGNRIDDIGVFRNGYWYLDLNGNRTWGGLAGGDTVFSFGISSDIPIIGDWNYDRIDDVGVDRNGSFYLDQNGSRDWNGSGGGDVVVSFGAATDRPLIGRWKPNAVSPTSASTTFNGPTTNSSDNLTFTAAHAGNDGNYVSVTLTNATNASTAVSVTGNAILVRLGADTNGNVVVTASQVAAADSARTSASALVTAIASGTGTGLVGTAATQFLSNGVGTAGLILKSNFRSTEVIDLGVSGKRTASTSRREIPRAPLAGSVLTGESLLRLVDKLFSENAALIG